jgi:GNAT superfamily N-acetyltransferase
MQLRPATPADALEVAGVHVRSWQVGYRGLLPDEYLNGLRVDDRAERYQFDGDDDEAPRTIVAVDSGVIVGFATSALAVDADATGSGELCALYVDPPRWGGGVGQALLRDTRERLRSRGFSDAILWVLAGNTRAERVYHRDGWRADDSRRQADVWGITVDEVRYRRTL